MVAIINLGKSIRRAFHYNENKFKEGVAERISVRNFFGSGNELDHDKALEILLRFAETRPDVEVNSVHISLNFSPSERIDDGRMKAIADEYMEQIGFGEQPYLIYRHHDSGHPHCHIVTTNVTIDGNRIPLHKIGKLRSEPARKAIEEKYGLVKAEQQRRQVFSLNPVDAQKVQYGISETRQAIGNVLGYVLKKYKYTSLPELNAVLNMYNVHAERGSEDSRTYKNKGLFYRILDRNGEPIGVPIKASLFYNRPTLAFLEKQFLRNDVARQEHQSRLKSIVDFAIRSKQPGTVQALADILKSNGIRMVVRTGRDGNIYGITYVDFKSGAVFNGSSLGKTYSAKAIQERLTPHQSQNSAGREQAITLSPNTPLPDPKGFEQHPNLSPVTPGKSLLDDLMQHEYASQQVPYEWRKKKRKKR